jgi:hypothetical protein
MIDTAGYVCERCGKTFKTSQGLAGHKKGAHSIGLDELDAVLKGEMSPDEGLARLKEYRAELDQQTKQANNREDYAWVKWALLVLAMIATILILFPKLEAWWQSNEGRGQEKGDPRNVSF